MAGMGAAGLREAGEVVKQGELEDLGRELLLVPGAARWGTALSTLAAQLRST